MFSEVTGDFSSSIGITNYHYLFDLKVFEKLLEVVGIIVHVVSILGLSRSSIATPIMCDNTVAVFSKERHLIFPIVTAQRPAMGEGDDIALWVAPVLIEELGSISKLQIWHSWFNQRKKLVLGTR